MSNQKLNSTIQFANAISSFLNSQKPSASYQIKKTLLGFLIKTPNSKNQTTDYSYFFISQDFKQSIKCKFNQEMSMEIDLAYSIQINEFAFDFIVTEKNEKTIQYNLILIVNNCLLLEAKRDITKKIINAYPININKDNIFKDLITVTVNKLFHGIINEYYSIHNHEEFSASNFMNKQFKKKEEDKSLYQMIQNVFRAYQKGVFLLKREGVEYPYQYFSDIFDIQISLLGYDWKKIMKSTPTIKDKEIEKGDPFVPIKVDVKEFSKQPTRVNIHEFLGRKTMRSESTNNEEEANNNVKSVVDFYENINRSMGSSFIEKYLLFKRYSELMKESI